MNKVSQLVNSDLRLRILGHLGMLGLIILAYILWRERSTTYDSSLYGYMIITRESVYTPHDRWINYLWQWMPIMAVKLGVSLTTFLKVMSIAPLVFLYGIYNLITHAMKNSLAGIYMVLIMLVLIRYKFYSAIPEIYLGTAFVALMVGLLSMEWQDNSRRGSSKKIVIGLGILFLNYLGHPLMFYPMAAVIALDFLIKGDWKSVVHLSLLILCALLFGVKFLIGKGSSHEAPVINNFFDSISSGNFIESTSNLYSLEIFWMYLETQWAFPFVLVLTALIYLVYKKKYLFVIALVAASTIWVIFVAHLGAYLEGSFLFMIEGYYILLGPILFLPLIYISWQHVLAKYFQFFILIVLIGFGLHRIYSVRPFYTDRISDINQKIEQGRSIGARNIIAPAGTEMWEKYWYLWSVPFESLMHSSLHPSAESSVLMINTYPDKKYFEEPFEVMIGVDTDSLKHITTPYFKFDNSPFVSLK